MVNKQKIKLYFYFISTPELIANLPNSLKIVKTIGPYLKCFTSVLHTVLSDAVGVPISWVKKQTWRDKLS